MSELIFAFKPNEPHQCTIYDREAHGNPVAAVDDAKSKINTAIRHLPAGMSSHVLGADEHWVRYKFAELVNDYPASRWYDE